METKDFTLLELLQARTWLCAFLSATPNFVHVKTGSEEVTGARQRLKEIDQELIDRLMLGKDEPKIFKDKEFEQTIASTF